MGKPYDYNAVMIGQGAAVDPKTIARGAAGTVLTQVTAGAEPVFGDVNLATMITGTVPAANGGTGQDSSASTGVAQVAAGTWSFSAVDLATADVTGVLPIANGGTAHALGNLASMQCWGVAVVSAGGTMFLGADSSVAAVNIQFAAPWTGVVLRMNTHASAAPGGTDTFTYRARVAGNADAGTEIVVTGAATDGTSTFSLAVTRADSVCVRLIGSATAAVANHMVTLAIRVDA